MEPAEHSVCTMERALQLLCLAGLVFGAQSTSACDNTTSIANQVDLLLAEYDRGASQGAPVRVTVALDVQHATIYEKTSSARMLGALHLSWEDKRLSWNASSWGCNYTLVSSERLWLPDVGVVSAATTDHAAGDAAQRARLTSDGRVTWIVRLDLIAPFTLTLRDWPRDVQEVIFKFGSRSHSADEVDLILNDIPHATVFESGTWEILKVYSTEMTWKRLDVEQQVLAWRVLLQRRASAHELAVAAVLAASMLLLVASALLPPASRPPLCATATLVGSLWLISALVRLPGSSTAPLAMSLVCVVSVCGAAAAAGAALVQRVARCSSPPPHALRTLVISTSTFCKLIPPEGSSAEWSAWAAAAQLLDYVLLAAMLLTLFVVMCLCF